MPGTAETSTTRLAMRVVFSLGETFRKEDYLRAFTLARFFKAQPNLGIRDLNRDARSA